MLLCHSAAEWAGDRPVVELAQCEAHPDAHAVAAAAPLSVGAAMRAVAQPYGAERSRRQRIGFSRRVLMPRTGHAPGQGYAIQPG